MSSPINNNNYDPNRWNPSTLTLGDAKKALKTIGNDIKNFATGVVNKINDGIRSIKEKGWSEIKTDALTKLSSIKNSMVESFGKITRSVVKRFNPDAGARMSMNHYREKLEKELSTNDAKTNFELNKALSNLCKDKDNIDTLKGTCKQLKNLQADKAIEMVRNSIKQKSSPTAGSLENQQNNINTNSRSQDSTQTNSTQQKSPPSLPPKKQSSISAEKSVHLPTQPTVETTSSTATQSTQVPVKNAPSVPTKTLPTPPNKKPPPTPLKPSISESNSVPQSSTQPTVAENITNNTISTSHPKPKKTLSSFLKNLKTKLSSKENKPAEKQTTSTSFKTLKEQKEFLDKLEDENYDIRTNEDMWGIFAMAKKFNSEDNLDLANLFINELKRQLDELEQKETPPSTSINDQAKQSITDDLKNKIANLRNAPDELDEPEDEIPNLKNAEDPIKKVFIPKPTIQEEKPSINDKSNLIEMIKGKNIQTEDDSFDFESLQNEINNLNKENASGIILNMETWVEDNMYDSDDNYNEIKDNLDQASKTTDINEQKTYLNKAYNLMKNN